MHNDVAVRRDLVLQDNVHLWWKELHLHLRYQLRDEVVGDPLKEVADLDGGLVEALRDGRVEGLGQLRQHLLPGIWISFSQMYRSRTILANFANFGNFGDFSDEKMEVKFET